MMGARSWILAFRKHSVYASLLVTPLLTPCCTFHLTGSPPKRLRLHMPSSDPSRAIRVRMQFTNAQRVEAEVNSRVLAPLNRLPTLADPTGSYYFNATEMAVTVIVSGRLPVTLIQRPVVAVSLRMDTTLDNFYESRFVANVAFLLRIDISRIRVVSIRRGSVIVDFQVQPDPALLAVRGMMRALVLLCACFLSGYDTTLA
jgi:hypothetical protein